MRTWLSDGAKATSPVGPGTPSTGVPKIVVERPRVETERRHRVRPERRGRRVAARFRVEDDRGGRRGGAGQGEAREDGQDQDETAGARHRVGPFRAGGAGPGTRTGRGPRQDLAVQIPPEK